MSRNRYGTLVIALICAVTLLVGGVAQVSAASEKSDGKNMKKVLKYYKQGNYSKARKYNKKMNKKASERCVANMSADMKAAYLKKVKKYVSKYGTEIATGGVYVWDYFLTDIDNDKKADLLVEYGSCEADVQIAAFRYKSGKVKKLGKTYCSHTSFSAYPGHKGIVFWTGHMGYEALYVVTAKGGKLKSKLYGDRELGNNGKSINLRCALKSHRYYAQDYSSSWLDYSALE